VTEFDVIRPARNTRPANRRELIVLAATDLFYRKGYADVAMSDVADAVAIGPSALYRHFRGKQSLLAAVVHEALVKIDNAITAAADDESVDVATTLAMAVIEHRGVGVMWRREARNLSADARTAFRAEARVIGTHLTEIVARRRPDLDPAAAELLAWCSLTVANSVSFHSLSLPEPDFTVLVSELISSVLAAPPPNLGEPVASPPEVTALVTASRRESILAAATELFSRQGFAGVSMDDIGGAVGIAGPSVYKHFEAKSDILSAAMFRADEWLRMEMARAFAQASDPRDGLERLVRSYSHFVFDNPHLVQNLVSETQHLPDADRRRTVAAQLSYIGEWVHLLVQVYPGYDPVRARIRVQAAQTMLNDIAMTPRLRKHSSIESASAAIGLELLTKAHRQNPD
jgi:AcrR family transcriptional regulator